VDGCRVSTTDALGGGVTSRTGPEQKGNEGWTNVARAEALGRWPANVLHDGSEGVVSTFPDTGTSTGGRIGNASGAYANQGRTGWGMGHEAGDPGFGDAGSASRFFQRVKVKGAGGSEARDLIEYLRTMITPPDENLPPTPEGGPSKAVFLHVEDPEAFDWSAYADQSVHAMVANGPSALRGTACGEGDDEVGAWISEAYRVLKPGAHLLLVAPEDEVTGHTGACVAEDLGFEVRDAILLLTEDSVGKFHYTAKSGRSEREAGLFDSEFDYGQQDETRKEGNPGGDNPRNRGLTKRKNVHPTVKPVEIMEFCLRDVPRDAGPVLDPFLGSGTTLLACIETGHDGIGIEREEEYAQIADARIRHRDYETAGWNRAEFISPFSEAVVEAPVALPPKEISLDDFFGVGD